MNNDRIYTSFKFESAYHTFDLTCSWQHLCEVGTCFSFHIIDEKPEAQFCY